MVPLFRGGCAPESDDGQEDHERHQNSLHEFISFADACISTLLTLINNSSILARAQRHPRAAYHRLRHLISASDNARGARVSAVSLPRALPTAGQDDFKQHERWQNEMLVPRPRAADRGARSLFRHDNRPPGGRAFRNRKWRIPAIADARRAFDPWNSICRLFDRTI
jgi:hypothetical protein